MRRVVAVFLCLFVLAVGAVAQTSDTGSIAGTIQDNSQGVIAAAVVVATSDSGTTQTVNSDDSGEYVFKLLPVGTYTIAVNAPGFKENKAAGVLVTVGAVTRADIVMVPAANVSSVTVETNIATQIEQENAQIAGVITTKEVTTYALNGRNFTQLVALAPGVSNQTGQDEALVGVKGSVKYSVNGGRVEYNTYDVDGGDILNASLNGSSSTLIVYPSLDAINELQVLTSNYGAQYGRSASGTILATTKNGTNEFHGDAYFFARNNIFNARNFFDQTKHAPLYQKYDPGFTIGGPLFIPGHYNSGKDKTFFFVSEEWRHDKEPVAFNQAVPSNQERDCRYSTPTIENMNNDFCLGSAAAGVHYGNFSDVCPDAGPLNPYFPGISPGAGIDFVRTKYPDCPGHFEGGSGSTLGTFGGNYVRFDPVSYRLLTSNFIPFANSTTGCNSSIHSCYDVTVSPLTTYHEDLFRLDHNFNSKQKIYFRYIHDAYTTDTPVPQYAYVYNSFPTIQNTFAGPGLSMVAHWSMTLGNNFVNDAAMAYTTDHVSLQAVPGPGVQTLVRPGNDGSPGCEVPCPIGSIFGPQNIPGFNFGGKSPGIVIGGTNAAYGGHGFAVDTGFTPWSHSNPTYSPRDDATFILKKHTMQFGVLFIIAQRSEINPPVGTNTGDLQGIAYFNDTNYSLTSGNAFADYVGGNPRVFQQDSAQNKYHNNYKIVEPYFQDNWKVSPRLTVNMGLRISLFGTYSEKSNYSYNWVQSQYSAALASEVTVDPSFGNLRYNGTGNNVPLDPNNLDPHLVNGVVRCGVSSYGNGQKVPASCMSGHLFNPAPRLGIAWDPFGDGKTSIRAGYGIFFEHGTGNEANTGSLEGSAGNISAGGVIDATQFFPTTWASIGTIGITGQSGAAYPLNLTSIPTHAVWPYAQQWSFSIQRDMPFNLLGSLAYVGSKGTHLTAELQVNQLTPVPAADNPFAPGQALTANNCSVDGLGQYPIGTQLIGPTNPIYQNVLAACSGIASTQTYDPNSLRLTGNSIAPSLGQIYSLQNVANSSYNALQATLRRVKGPLTLGVSYTYSHSIDDSSDRTSAYFVNAYNLKQNRASSDFDQRHLLNVSYIYQLPFERILSGLTDWADSDPTNQVASHDLTDFQKSMLSGWELAGITIYQTGTPFSILNAGSNTGISSLDNAGVAAVSGPGSYPDIVANPGAVGHVATAPGATLFGPLLGNPNEFVAPTGLTYGNAGRNFERNPGRLNFDMSVLKSVKIKENYTLQFRAEAFNVFNHTQFRVYDASNVGNTGNNVITCYGGANNSAGDPSCVANSSFLRPVDAHRPRTIQLGVKFLF